MEIACNLLDVGVTPVAAVREHIERSASLAGMPMLSSYRIGRSAEELHRLWHQTSSPTAIRL